MYCAKCGRQLPDNTTTCSYCSPYEQAPAVQVPPPAAAPPQGVPKCTCCGYVGQWKVEPLFRAMDWVIGLILLFFFGAGLVYFLVVGLIRANKNNRAKICPNCNARNLWTFLY